MDFSYVCCGNNQSPGEGTICQEQNSSLFDCQHGVQKVTQLYLAHLTGVIRNYLDIKHRVMSIAVATQMWWSNSWNSYQRGCEAFDNISVVLNYFLVMANRGARRRSLLFGHFHRDFMSPSSGETCFLRHKQWFTERPFIGEKKKCVLRWFILHAFLFCNAENWNCKMLMFFSSNMCIMLLNSNYLVLVLK